MQVHPQFGELLLRHHPRWKRGLNGGAAGVGRRWRIDACCVVLPVYLSIGRRLGKDVTLVAEKLQCTLRGWCVVGHGENLTFFTPAVG